MYGNEIKVHNFNNEQGTSEVALVEFSGEKREELIQAFQNNLMIKGEYIQNGGVISSKNILTLVSAVAAGEASKILSGKLFIATANPATLMAIKGGVGSAVMGTTGIIGQAPFIAASSAILPVAAPIIAFQAIVAIQKSIEFDKLNEKLDDIKTLIETSIERNEATHIGVIISSFSRIEEIEKQYIISKRFTQDMLIRLSLIENEIFPLLERNNYLYQKNSFHKDITDVDLKFKKLDALMAILTSVLYLRISVLKLKVVIQESPEYLSEAQKDFNKKLDIVKGIWVSISEIPELIQKLNEEILEDAKKANPIDKIKGKQNEAIIKMQNLVEETKLFKDLLDEKLKETKLIINEINKNSGDLKMNLVYWKDELGEHSFYTDDLTIE